MIQKVETRSMVLYGAAISSGDKAPSPETAARAMPLWAPAEPIGAPATPAVRPERVERTALPADHPALRRPLPVVCGNEATFNFDRCHQGKKCEATVCIYYHSDKEKRCPWSMSNDCQHMKNGHCRMGLHVDIAAICETFTLDLECPAQAMERLQKLVVQPAAHGASFSRLVVFGLAFIRKGLLKKFFEHMPLLHEIILPDRKREPNLLVVLCDILEDCWKLVPRLRTVVFEDGAEELLW